MQTTGKRAYIFLYTLMCMHATSGIKQAMHANNSQQLTDLSVHHHVNGERDPFKDVDFPEAVLSGYFPPSDAHATPCCTISRAVRGLMCYNSCPRYCSEQKTARDNVQCMPLTFSSMSLALAVAASSFSSTNFARADSRSLMVWTINDGEGEEGVMLPI